MSELLTPSQTAGPYFSMRLPWDQGPYAVPAGTPRRDHHHRAAARRGIKGSRLAVIRGASHFAHFQAPGPVTDALLTHFRAAR